VSSSTTRRVLILDTDDPHYRLQALRPGAESPLFGGEALCQHLLEKDPQAMVIARGPLAFLSGNKTTVGYVSPLTSAPHYSFVGGRGFAELLHLGLDAIVLAGSGRRNRYVVVSGRAPSLQVEWKPATDLPAGQRAAFYELVRRELDGQPDRGSIFTLGEAIQHGYRAANLGVDGLYHAGRGGAGQVMACFAAALVLRGEPLTVAQFFGPRLDAFLALREGEIRQRLDTYCDRLARRDGGTVTKLYRTGSGRKPTLPVRNAQRLGTSAADLGSPALLRARRAGQTGCHWCQVNCRHWHWVEAGYAPAGRDRLLDDFEPTYAIVAMLDLRPADDSVEANVHLMDEIENQILLPIEQLGCDVIDIGVGLAALFEGLERGLIPKQDAPDFLQGEALLGRLEPAAQSVAALRAGATWPALRAVGNGPQALADRYPSMQPILFTSGRQTLGNPGHANALWTFLMPFSRYFGHYAGQLYKVEGTLPAEASAGAVQPLFERVVREALQREFFGCLGNALSACAFTFAVFGQDGEGRALDDCDLLVRTLAVYGIQTDRVELEWAAEAFWAQSMALKLQTGWQPPAAAGFPERVFEALSLALERPASELRELMDLLIAEWRRQAGDVLHKFGHEPAEGW
jgi:aldehyde:ferredoxin oxidoreductase